VNGDFVQIVLNFSRSGQAVLILVGQDAILIWTTVGQRLVDEKTMDVEPFPIIDQLLA